MQAVHQTGVKMNLGLSVTSFDDRNLEQCSGYIEMLDLLNQKGHNSANGRFKLDTSIHAEYTNTPKIVEQMAGAAKKHALNMHIHLSESFSEHEACKARHQVTPTQFFHRLGAFDVNATVAHGVWLEGEDMELLAEKKATVATCPASNLKLTSGICPVPKLLKKGVRVALGTDSVASNNSFNMLIWLPVEGCRIHADWGNARVRQ